MKKKYIIAPLGDSAIIIEWEQEISPVIHQRVLNTYHYLRSLQHIYILDLIPAYASLTVIYNARAARYAYDEVIRIVTDALNMSAAEVAVVSRQIEIPVCYDPSLGPDLLAMAEQKSLSVDKIVELHTQTTYTVYMLGFLPGFPYMGTVDDILATPRLKKPRVKIPAGSVGIAGAQTGIYPLDSPGGWNLIGKTPVRMFDAEKEIPCYCQPGDQVRFVPVSLEEFHELNHNRQ
ncbi:5-oxoprolinase subunit PxpB [Chitinophaga tropicalis]|uniref:5-oxoprolinase subunit PxpB n=1 Tax=Chitinophaga tropicalis TaxID=2683588 RepID=A0A7K1TXB8_9BACT|nr:5-oxoprolinase subunit PxpB [Chitinophaga tropicalis]MVT06748.1 5-oxoprolinase subunit PxpB [Chitinophaga tropicalis]